MIVAPQSIAYGTATAALSANVAYTGATAPTGALTFRVDSGASVTGTCSGTASPLTCTASYSTSSLTAGSHTITATDAADANYTASTGTGSLTVTGVGTTVTVAPQTIAYGTATAALSASVAYSGSDGSDGRVDLPGGFRCGGDGDVRWHGVTADLHRELPDSRA